MLLQGIIHLHSADQLQMGSTSASGNVLEAHGVLLCCPGGLT